MILYIIPKVVPRLNLTSVRNPNEEIDEFNFLGITLYQNITWNLISINHGKQNLEVIGVLMKFKHIFLQHIYC